MSGRVTPEMLAGSASDGPRPSRGTLIREERERLGLSQAELALVSLVSRGTVRNAETDSPLERQTTAAIARAFGWHPDALRHSPARFRPRVLSSSAVGPILRTLITEFRRDAEEGARAARAYHRLVTTVAHAQDTQGKVPPGVYAEFAERVLSKMPVSEYEGVHAALSSTVQAHTQLATDPALLPALKSARTAARSLLELSHPTYSSPAATLERRSQEMVNASPAVSAASHLPAVVDRLLRSGEVVEHAVFAPPGAVAARLVVLAVMPHGRQLEQDAHALNEAMVRAEVMFEPGASDWTAKVPDDLFAVEARMQRLRDQSDVVARDAAVALQLAREAAAMRDSLQAEIHEMEVRMQKIRAEMGRMGSVERPDRDE